MRRLLKNRYVLPAAVLVAVGLGSALSVGIAGAGATSGASNYAKTSSAVGVTPTLTAGGAHFHNTPITSTVTVTAAATNCSKAADQIGYSGPANSGSPSSSTTVTCTSTNKKITSYGSTAITYTLPTSSGVTEGHRLFEQNCSSCHNTTAQGSTKAPSLLGVGPATINFWVTTGRMPATDPKQVQASRHRPRLTDKQANEIAAWVNSLAPSAPYIPTVHLKGANLTEGASLFAINCAACHTITGAGDALAFDTFAPGLHQANVQEVAEAIRTGPGNMPRFTGNLTDKQVRDIVAYVTQKIQHPTNTGGFGLGGIGPVTEGFVALLFGVGGLMLVCFWIGDRAR